MRYLVFACLALMLLCSCSTSRSGMTDMYKTATTVNAKPPQNQVQKSGNTIASKQPQLKSNGTDQKRRRAIVTTSKKYLGCKYKAGAMGPKQFDCSGFTCFVFQKHGVQLTRTSKEQYRQGTAVTDTRKLLPGDLVFWTGSNAKSKVVGHVGIVETVNKDGTFTFVHASNSGVRIDNSETIYYKVRYKGARRVL